MSWESCVSGFTALSHIPCCVVFRIIFSVLLATCSLSLGSLSSFICVSGFTAIKSFLVVSFLHHFLKMAVSSGLFYARNHIPMQVPKAKQLLVKCQ